MIDVIKYSDVREIKKEDLEGVKKLGENEYLLKILDETGFMAKLNKNGAIPASFDSWGEGWYGNTKPLQWYIIEEKFRRDWEFVGLRYGQSTAWVVLRHPFGFKIEINSYAFQEITNKITMVNGRMVTPCYFQAKLRNAELLVEKDPNQDLFYSMVKAVTDDSDLLNKLGEIIEEERPDKVYTALTESR